MTKNPTPVSLRALLSQLPPGLASPGLSDAMITGIEIDSRSIERGDLFVALRGALNDGHDFIGQALSNGASAVAGDRDIAGLSVPYVRLQDSRRALSWIAAAFHGWPGRQLVVLGVTGTDGKTTTANLIYSILRAAGIKAGLISTVNIVIGRKHLETGLHVTTPDAHEVQAYLAKMVAAGLSHAVLETTSHGWSQHRIDACAFDIGVVTNITHEHLDEHGSYENYRAAKARLLTSLEVTPAKPHGTPPLAVLNRDDRSFEFLDRHTKVNRLSYGLQDGADLMAIGIVDSSSGIGFTAVTGDMRVAIKANLIGPYNIHNCLAAIGATVVGLRIPPETAAEGIRAMPGVEGRMERIDMGQAFVAVVDFAHTPNALRAALDAARRTLGSRTHASRLIVVVGSAGLRDRAKRRMMAEAAAELADISVFTAEDPRTELLDGILAEMSEGARSRGGREGETFWCIRDRGEAIRFAVRQASERDVVLACGKGHEQSMCFGDTEYPWDDRLAMRAALAELLDVAGPAMPFLPTRDSGEDDWLQ
jgi:UDP-N-acetylmuramoyl-L-alanyl-D-glutamate--2,6-diaminopimelate ligase